MELTGARPTASTEGPNFKVNLKQHPAACICFPRRLMRKAAFGSTAVAASLEPPERWLHLEDLAHVAVSSEDPNHLIESAFSQSSLGSGWRAGGRGEQTIQLIFDPPRLVRRIWLRFS